MEINKYKTDIEELIVYLLTNDLVLDTNNPVIRGNGNIKELIWASAPKSGHIYKLFASFPEYINLIEKRQYNFILKDGGIIQIGFIFDNESIIKQKLNYYPCPIQISEDEINDIQHGEDFVVLLKLFLSNELKEINSYFQDDSTGYLNCRLFNRSPFRFDYDPSSDTSIHCPSHLHINKESCRWPSFGPISIGHFIRFIFRSFYPEIWKNHEKIREWPISPSLRSITSEHISDLFIEDIYSMNNNLISNS